MELLHAFLLEVGKVQIAVRGWLRHGVRLHVLDLIELDLVVFLDPEALGIGVGDGTVAVVAQLRIQTGCL